VPACDVVTDGLTLTCMGRGGSSAASVTDDPVVDFCSLTLGKALLVQIVTVPNQSWIGKRGYLVSNPFALAERTSRRRSVDTRSQNVGRPTTYPASPQPVRRRIENSHIPLMENQHISAA
jgi:hypothetical protein